MALFTSMGGQEPSSALEMIERSEGQPPTGSVGSGGEPAPSAASDETANVTASDPALQLQNSFRSVSQRVLPSVVEVNVVSIVEQQVGMPFPFFGRQQGETREFRRSGLGSGVIVARDGDTVYVLTNHHVIAQADEVSVTLYDERSFDVQVVGSDESKDLALVSFETDQEVPLATLGDSDTLMVGDWVLAVGNPFGFESTVTAGIVSAIGREANQQNGLTGYNEYIQTDAAINQGNSGGALVNIFGEVVGINSWIASPSGGNIGLGFAIPINTAKAAIDDFVQYGSINYGWLGVSIGEVPPDMREELELGEATGSFIYNIYLSAPAAVSGVLPGDYITAVDGMDIENATDLARTIGEMESRTTVALQIIRAGRTMSLDVELGERPEDPGTLWPGFSAVSLTDEIRSRLDDDAAGGQVIVASVADGSPAARVGIRSGDVVLEVDGGRIRSLIDFYEALGDANDRSLELRIVREGQILTVGLKVPR
jgi:serine protease Do